MKLLKHYVIIAFLLPIGLMAQDSQKIVNISINKVVDGEDNQYEFKYIIDDTDDIETLIEEVKEKAGVSEETEGVAVDIQVEIEETMTAEENADKPYLGVALGIKKEVEALDDDITEITELIVEEAFEDGAAAAAGVEAGDKLIAIDGQTISAMGDLKAAMANSAIGDELPITVERAGENMDFTLFLTGKPLAANKMYEKHMMKQHCDDNWIQENCPDGVYPGCCDAFPANKVVMGVSVMDTEEGVKVTSLTDNGGADQAGMRVNDLIKTVAKKEVATMADLLNALAPYKPNEKVKIGYERDGKVKKAKVVLQARQEKQTEWSAKEAPAFDLKHNETAKENVTIIRLDDAEMDDLMGGTEVKVRVSQEDENGQMFTQEISIQLEDGADPCPEFNVIITRLDEVDKEAVSANDQAVNMSKMSDLKVINLSLFPNPNTGKFELEFSLEEDQPVTVRLISLSGKEIYREDLNNFTGKYSNFIDISQNAAGVYVLQVMQNEQILTRKIVIEK